MPTHGIRRRWSQRSNVLVYATLNQDAAKKRVAASLIMEAVASDSFCISSQVLKEFANILIRKSNRLPPEIREDVRRFSRFVVVPDTPDLVLDALDLRRDYDLQFFDALIVAGAERADCDTIYSEDMADGAHYGRVTIVNPFKNQHP